MSVDQAKDLLEVLCVTYGFCLHSPSYDELRDSPPATAIEFLHAVMRADGVVPETADRQMYQDMLEVVRGVYYLRN